MTTNKIKESKLLKAKFNLNTDKKIKQVKKKNTTQKEIKTERAEALDRVC